MITQLGAAADARIWQAAHHFEAMAIGQMLKPMLTSAQMSDNFFGGGQAEKIWTPMLANAIAKQMELRGGIGLAQAVHDALLHQQEAKANGRAAPRGAPLEAGGGSARGAALETIAPVLAARATLP